MLDTTKIKEIYTPDRADIFEVLNSDRTVIWRKPGYFKGLTFTAREDSKFSFTGNNFDLKWSYDGTTWNKLNPNEEKVLTQGQRVFLKGDNDKSLNGMNFKISGAINASGNIMSLVTDSDGSGIHAIPYNNMFQGLFKECSGLKSAPSLNWSILKPSCYRDMFAASGIEVCPALPSKILPDHCYYGMFSGCANIRKISKQFAGEKSGVGAGAASYMYGWSGISELEPGTFHPINAGSEHYAENYSGMFFSCQNITSLPSGLWADGCYCGSSTYGWVFQDCFNIKNVPDDVFGGKMIIRGDQAFQSCFRRCYNIPSIPFPEVELEEGRSWQPGTFDCYINMTDEGSSTIPDEKQTLKRVLYHNKIWPPMRTNRYQWAFYSVSTKGTVYIPKDRQGTWPVSQYKPTNFTVEEY